MTRSPVGPLSTAGVSVSSSGQTSPSSPSEDPWCRGEYFAEKSEIKQTPFLAENSWKVRNLSYFLLKMHRTVQSKCMNFSTASNWLVPDLYDWFITKYSPSFCQKWVLLSMNSRADWRCCLFSNVGSSVRVSARSWRKPESCLREENQSFNIFYQEGFISWSCIIMMSDLSCAFWVFRG